MCGKGEQYLKTYLYHLRYLISDIYLQLIKAFQIEYISELDIQFEFLLAPKTPVQIRFSDRF